MVRDRNGIKRLRSLLGISQQKFADSIGVSQQSVAAYESGRRTVSEAVLKKINEVYGNMISEKAWDSLDKKEEKRDNPRIFIQFPEKEISIEEISHQIGLVDAIYIKPQDGKVYWVKDGKTGLIIF